MRFALDRTRFPIVVRRVGVCRGRSLDKIRVCCAGDKALMETSPHAGCVLRPGRGLPVSRRARASRSQSDLAARPRLREGLIVSL